MIFRRNVGGYVIVSFIQILWIRDPGHGSVPKIHNDQFQRLILNDEEIGTTLRVQRTQLAPRCR